jgi:hypothetical protein
MLTRQKRAFILEKLKRLEFYHSSLNYKFFKFIFFSSLFSTQIKIFMLYYFHIFFVTSSLTRHKNMCFKTSYKRSVNTFLKLNRLQAIEQISQLKLPGFSLAK